AFCSPVARSATPGPSTLSLHDALPIFTGVLLCLGAPLQPGAVVAAGPGSHVCLDPDDRLDAGLGRGVVELVGAEEVAVIGDRDRFLALTYGFVYQFVDLRGPVQHRIGGMDMAVHEVVGHADPPSSRGRRVGATQAVDKVTGAGSACPACLPSTRLPRGVTCEVSRSMRRPRAARRPVSHWPPVRGRSGPWALREE